MTNHVTRDPITNSSDAATKSSARSKQKGCCLSLSDHDRIRIFVHEFFVRGLIPWAERTLRILNDQVWFIAYIE